MTWVVVGVGLLLGVVLLPTFDSFQVLGELPTDAREYILSPNLTRSKVILSAPLASMAVNAPISAEPDKLKSFFAESTSPLTVRFPLKFFKRPAAIEVLGLLGSDARPVA